MRENICERLSFYIMKALSDINFKINYIDWIEIKKILELS